ncbi:MAG: hypothetical protein K0U16_07475 [Gammaproteobacteria bacterium]|nr:hypothetical protein [Gammaproteobacteria bacterium]
MLEAENFHPDSKRTLNASRHARAIEQADAIEDDLTLMLVSKQRPDPGLMAQLVEALATAMATAPDGDRRSALWTRYCRWQLRFVDVLSEAVAFLHESTGPDGTDQRYQVFQLYYCDHPAPFPGRLWEIQDELAAAGLLRISKSPNVEEWRTPLGRAVVLHMNCDIALDMEAITNFGGSVEDLVAFQQRVAADIRAVDGEAVKNAVALLRDESSSGTRYTMLAALAAVARDPQLWDALSQVRQGICGLAW